MNKIFYRFYTGFEHERINLICEEFVLVSETLKGWWIIQKDNPYRIYKKRWISKTSKKRHAYPTQKEALNNYIIRTKRRIGYLINSTENANKGLKKAKKLMENYDR